MAGLTGWHLLILLGALVLLFGAGRLPDAARAVGRSARVFKGEMRGMAADDEARARRAAPPATPTEPGSSAGVTETHPPAPGS